MRVGVLVHALTGGGGEAVAQSWAEQLRARGHEITFLLYEPDATADDHSLHTTCVFPGRSVVARWVGLPGWVRRTALEHRLDVVLSVLDFSNLTALRALARPGARAVPVVISEHTVPTVHWRYDGVGGRVKKELAKLLYRRADGVIAVSHPVAADLRAGYGVAADRLFILPNPVQAVDAPFAPASAPGGGLRRVMVVGRLSQVKRVDRLFDVLTVLRDRGLACAGVVVGDGPVRAELEEHALRLQLPVQFLGWATPWQQHVRSGDCLLVTADVEGFGNVLVEAAAAGLPAVAPSTALGVADALVPGVTGVLAWSSRAEDLADALVEAATLPVRPELVEAWLRGFSPALAAGRLEAALTQVHQRTPSATSPDGTAVTHVGPGPDGTGGMASVLRAYRSMPSSHREPRFIGSYSPDSSLWSAGPFVRAGARLLHEAPDRLGIVHAHLSFGGSFVREGALMALARARRLPVVATLHGSDFLEFLDSHPRLVRGVLGLADRIVVLSEEVRQRLPPELRARAVVVPNPVPVPEPEPSPAGEAPPVALFAGEVALRKGVDVLLRAWPQVVARVPGARVLIAGAPSKTNAVLPVDLPGVHWLGAVDNDEVRRLLRSSRLAVLPSRRDAMPIFLLEAMAAGRPVVTTSVGAIPETVAGAGRVVAPEDSDALAAAMTELLTDAEAATRLGTRGRRRVVDLFSLEAVAGQLDALYDEVVVG
jgi:glycosyltransferase involved in cell wall biosynthesis